MRHVYTRKVRQSDELSEEMMVLNLVFQVH
jgi:hypothetical protein